MSTGKRTFGRRLVALLAATMFLLPAAAPAWGQESGPVRITWLERDGADLRIRTAVRDGQALAAQALDALRSRPDVVAAGVDARYHALDAIDPRRDDQWGLDALDAEQVWADADACGQVIGVVDTGVDGRHPDLGGMLSGGENFISSGSARVDPNGHGTHVAGIAAAAIHNDIGIAGLAYAGRIMPLRALDDLGGGFESDVAAAVIWATDNGATVLNLSLGGPSPGAGVLRNAIDYALAHGVIVVAAAGNSGLADETYPAAWPGVVAVGAVDRSLTHASFSNTGGFVDLVAPGVDITSTWPGRSYRTLEGTSAATPFVSATAAMVRARHPQLSAPQVRARLTDTATDLGPAGDDDQYGAGLVNALAATAGSGQAPPCFTDATGIHEANIRAAAAAGITAGCAHRLYCPERDITRAEMATFLRRATGLPGTQVNPFSDIAGNPHAADIRAIAAAGITAGCGDGKYCPNDPVTRAQMATFLVLAFELAGSNTNYFVDDNSSIHEANINALRAAGVTAGCGTSPPRYCPGQPVTRAQMATFVVKSLEQ